MRAHSSRFDRSAVMSDAHRTYRTLRGEWTFARSLRFAWAKAHERRARAERAQCWIDGARNRQRASRLDAAIAA